jgi:hypothetical protein
VGGSLAQWHAVAHLAWGFGGVQIHHRQWTGLPRICQRLDNCLQCQWSEAEPVDGCDELFVWHCATVS